MGNFFQLLCRRQEYRQDSFLSSSWYGRIFIFLYVHHLRAAFFPHENGHYWGLNMNQKNELIHGDNSNLQSAHEFFLSCDTHRPPFWFLEDMYALYDWFRLVQISPQAFLFLLFTSPFPCFFVCFIDNTIQEKRASSKLIILIHLMFADICNKLKCFIWFKLVSYIKTSFDIDYLCGA